MTLVMDDQSKEVSQLLRKAGVDAPEVKVAPLSESLVTITGARQPEGAPLPPPGQSQQPKRATGSGNRKAGGNRSRGNNRARRSDRSRRSNGR